MISIRFSKPRPEAPLEDPAGAPAAVHAPAVAEEAPIRALLAGVVDYAGLFPPAGLGLEEAARAYDRYRSGPHAWMLGAFVASAERLDELVRTLARMGPTRPVPLSVLAPTAESGARAIREARDLWSRHLDVRALELAPQDPKLVRPLAGEGVAGVQVFHEVPLDDRQEARLDAIAAAGAAAKVRTGGVTAAAFPHAVLLADFIRSCAERGLPFKATAGLHHPRRGRYRLTYEPRSPWGEMFGFLEVALVAALVGLRRIDTREAASLLGEALSEIELTDGALVWSGHRLTSQELADVRARFFRSFGSCSFEEPVADLTRLGLL